MSTYEAEMVVLQEVGAVLRVEPDYKKTLGME